MKHIIDIVVYSLVIIMVVISARIINPPVEKKIVVPNWGLIEVVYIWKYSVKAQTKGDW